MSQSTKRVRFLLRSVDERLGSAELPLLSVSQFRGVVLRSELTSDDPRADDLSNYKVCRPGDIVINRMSAYQGALGRSPHHGIVSPDYVVMRPEGDVESRWLHHLMRSRWFVGEMAARIRGIGSIGTGNVRTPRVSAEEVGDIRVSVPDPSVQRAIADFLDAETARIDALITKKRRLIELLDERRIAHTRSIIGSAREGAGSVKLRHVCHVKRGQSPRPIDDPVYFEQAGSHGWVRIQDVTVAGKYLRSTRDRLSDLGRSRSVAVGPGIVLVSIAASIGKAVITDMDCCYHDGFVGLHNLREDPEYVYSVLSLPEAFAGMGQVGTQANINSEIVGEVRIPLLPVEQQRRLVGRITNAERQIDAARGSIVRQLDLLVEHRSALITAAVTGQSSVPGVAA